MRLRRRLAIAALLTPLVLFLLTWIAFHDYVRGGAFVVKAAGLQGVARTLADWHSVAVTVARTEIAWRQGRLPARSYTPARRSGRTFLLAPGVHASGVDEPRLIGFATDLAAMGHVVVTIGPPGLAQYRVSPDTTDAIEDAASWLAAQKDLAPDGRITMMGISFAGGLSIVAAGRPALAGKVAAVVSLGGHGDLGRTLRYLCTGREPDGTIRPPHDYGVVIILLGLIDRTVPAGQVAGLREALLTFLEASRLDLIDKAQSAAAFERARAIEQSLPEPSRTLMGYVNRRDVTALGSLLLPLVPEAEAPGLSPERSAPPQVPVYLLHGADDNVIPAAESVLLGQALARQGNPVHVLATPLITHAEVDHGARLRDVWRLIHFFTAVLKT
jgi:dienelactone hydrolase